MRLHLLLSSVLLALALAGCPGKTDPDPDSGTQTDAGTLPGTDGGVTQVPDLTKSDVTVDRSSGVRADGVDKATLTITVRDGAGQPVKDVAVQVDVTGGRNTLSSPAPTNASGITTVTLSSTLAEQKTLTVTLAQGALATRPSVTFVPGPVSAFASTVVANPTSVTADGLSNTTITITALDANNNPIAGLPVTLSASGSENTFVQPGATDAQGKTYGTLRSNRAEAKAVTAQVGESQLLQQPQVQFVPGDAKALAFRVQPSTTVAGGTIAPGMEVAVLDAQGNLVTSPVDVTMAIGTRPTAGAVLSGTTTRRTEAGVARFGDLSIDKAGSGYTLAASAPGLSSATSVSFDVAFGSASRLAFVTQPSGTTAGNTLSPPVQVVVQDSSGNTITSSSAEVTLSLSGGTGGVLTGTTTVNAVNGVATFAGLSITLAGSYNLVATATGFSGASSTLFTISPAAAAKLAYAVQPSSAMAGAALSPPVEVVVQDAYGNRVPDSRTVSIALGSNPGQATLSGTTSASTVDGVATFSNLRLDKAASGYSLSASSGALTSVVSNLFDITAGSASQLIFTIQPSSVRAGDSINPAVQVTAQDAFGNTAISFAGSVTLAIGTNPGGGTLSGARTVPAVNGVASFGDLNIDKAGSGYTLSASSGNLSGTSAAFNVTANTPAKLAYSVQPANSAAGTAISPAVRVEVQDAYGNLTSSTRQVSIALGSNPGGSTLSGTLTRNAVAGVATFSDLSLNKPGTGYTLVASTPTTPVLPSVTSDTFNVSVGAPAKLAFVVQPSAGKTGKPLSPAVQVAVQDSVGNLVTSETRSISVSLGNNPGGSTLSGTLARSAVDGVATFDNLTLDKAGMGYTLVASAASVSQGTSARFDVTLSGVEGSRVAHHLTDFGLQDKPQDLSTLPIGAFVPQADGGFSYIDGGGDADGGFFIPEVPEQEYYLRVNNTLIVTSARSVDLGYHVQGRADVQYADADAGTYMAVDFTGLEPWQEQDTLQLYSSNAGVWMTDLSNLHVDGGSPLPGDTTLRQTYDYASFWDNRMVDSNSGDRAYFVQMSTRTPAFAPADAGLTYQAASRVLETSSLAVYPGGTGSAFGQMQSVPQNLNTSVDFRLAPSTPGSFGSYQGQVNPAASLYIANYYVSAVPNASYGLYDVFPELMVFNHYSWGSDGGMSNLNLGFTYGNPFPSSYTPTATAAAFFLATYALPDLDGGTASAAPVLGGLTMMDRYANFTHSPLQPALSPVRNPTVNGVSAFQNLTGMGTMPTLAWSAPERGTPSYYQVSFRELYIDTSNRRTRRGDVVVRIRTQATRLTVPPGFLQPGKSYYAAIRAYYQPGVDVSTQPFMESLPLYYADALSGILSP